MAGAPLGNDNPTRGKEWTSALRRAMAHKANGDYRETLLKIANAVIDKALDGDLAAWREIAEREDGKPAQALTVANEEGQEFRTVARIERVIVHPAD